MKKLIFISTTVLLLGSLSTEAQTRKGIIKASSTDAIVETTAGTVAGYQEDNIYVFKGLPYAQAERFIPAQPAKWEGVRSTRSHGPVCPQNFWWKRSNDASTFLNQFPPTMQDEDCMRMNIWTQGLGDGKKRPVMFYIHGGGYVNGSGHEMPRYDGMNMAIKGDVVAITVNHRLNILGFLDLSEYGEEYKFSANNGILDLVVALQWVRDNIEKFGGDPNSVTIYGQSGGGGKVTALLASPYAKGLFHKAIVQSGSMLTVGESAHSKLVAKRLFKVLNLEEGDIEGLRKLSWEELDKAGSQAVKEISEEGNITRWGPKMDGDFLPVQPFSPTAPEISKDIPLMVGTTLHEFAMSGYVPNARNMSLDEIKELLKERYGDNTDEYVKVFTKTYPDYKPIDLLDIDVRFRPGAIKQADLKAEQKGAPVYMYLFTWESSLMDGTMRSSHNLDIPFLMNNAYNSRHLLGGGEETYVLADRMSSAWLSFAKTGNPNNPNLPIEWEPYTVKKGATIIFDNELEIKYNHDRELIDFVNNIGKAGF